MALPATDNFNRANGSLGSNWTQANGTNNPRIASNTVGSYETVDSLVYWNADSFNADQYAQLVYRSGNQNFLGPAVHVTSNNGYGMEIGAGSRYLGKVVSGSYTELAQVNTAIVANAVYRMEITGTAIVVKQNGTTFFSVSDSALSSGSAGMQAYNVGTPDQWDDWEGGNIGGSPPTLEQEGFRFRNDDGSETTATWRQAQDADDSVSPSTVVRLRVLVNGTNDPAAENFRIEYKRSTDPNSAFRKITVKQ